MISTFTLSLLLCLICYRFGNVVYTAAIHWLRNALAFLYSDEVILFGSPIAAVKNGFIVYPTSIIIVDICILIVIAFYAGLYYIPKYIKQ